MKKLITLISALFIICTMNAQINFGANFVHSSPNGNFGDIANSAIGGSLEANFFLNNNFALGLDVQFTDFSDNNFSIFDVDMTILPISVKAEYYLTESKLQPFVGLGVGYYIVDGEINLGTAGNGLTFDLNSIGVSPRFGLVYGFSKTSSVVMNMQYNILFGQDYDSQALEDLLDPFKETNYFSVLLGYRFNLPSKGESE